MQVRQLCDSIKEVADDEEKLTELIGEIMIGGLPRHMRLQVKNSLTGEKFKTENIERVVNNIQTEAEHSYKNLKKNSPQKKTGAWRETKSEEEGMQHTQREQQKSPTRRDITCYRCQQKGHISAHCPTRKEGGPRRSARLREKKEEKVNEIEIKSETEVSNIEVNTTKASTNMEFTRPLWFMDIKANGHQAEALIDNGSTINLMTTELAQKFGCEVEEDDSFIINKFEAKKCTAGLTTMRVETIPTREDELTFLVVDSNYPKLIIGQPGLEQLEALCDHKNKRVQIAGQWILPKIHQSDMAEVHQININQTLGNDTRTRIEAVLEEFKDVFEPKEKYDDNGPIDFEIKLQDDQKIIENPRRRSPWRNAIINQQVKEDLKKGIIEECKESNYISEPVLVQKADGTWRFTVDYRKMNDKTVQDHYPLPRIEDILDQLQGNAIFSKIDAERGYHQLRVKIEDRPKTAFRTSMGIFQYRRMPMGIKNAAAAFQRKMERVLQGLIGKTCFVYQDDVIISSSNIDEHAEHLRQVLQRMRENSFTLKLKKCQFGYSELPFLGHVIRNGEILPDPTKISSMLNMKLPSDETEVKRFLGMIGYYRRFIKDFANKALPLFELTKKGRRFEMTPEAENAFLVLREAMVTAPILKMPDFKKPFLLRTDALEKAVGGAILQKHGTIYHPVAYHSQTLRRHQLSWPIWEKEAFALVSCVEKWRFYLEGNQFTVETDNSVVASLMKTKNPQKRVARWVTTLQEFNFEIKHIRGESNKLADILSRDIEGQYEINVGETIDIGREQRRDPEISAIIEFLETKKLPEDEKQARYIALRSDLFLIEDGVLYYVGISKKSKNEEVPRHPKRIVIPVSLRKTVLEDCHDAPASGHMDFQRTLARVEAKYYWEGMFSEVKRYCESCEDCYRKKPSRNRKQGELESIVVSEPWNTIGLDFIGPIKTTKNLNRFVIVLRDYATGWTEARATRDATAETTIDFIVDMINRYGVPEKIISDNATNFTSKANELLAQKLGVHHITITPYNPSANGQVERINALIIQTLRFYIDRNAANWDVFLPYAIFAINSSENPLTKVSPYFLFFGRDPNPPRRIHIAEDHSRALDKYTKDLMERVDKGRKIMKELKEKLKRDVEQSRRAYNPEFHKGELVFVKKHIKDEGKAKFDDQYIGPYEIMERVGLNNYVIKKEGTRDTLHVKDLKRYQGMQQEKVEEMEEGDWKEQEPDPNMDPEELVGRHVLVWWPKFKAWYHGVVIGTKGRRHLVKYFDRADNTPEDKDEIYEERLLGYKNPYKWKLLCREDAPIMEEGNLLET